jgi:hypothetical protein
MLLPIEGTLSGFNITFIINMQLNTNIGSKITQRTIATTLSIIFALLGCSTELDAELLFI